MKLYKSDDGKIIVLDNVELIANVEQESSKDGRRKAFVFRVRFASGEIGRFTDNSKEGAEEMRNNLIKELESYSVDQSL